MKTIWVVEQGHYSDYRVVGVFTTKENADRVANYVSAQDRWDKPTVAEWELDPLIDHLNAGRNRYHVYMRRGGEVESAQRQDSTYDMVGKFRIWRRSKAYAYKGTDTPDVLDAAVWADSDAHAIKIVNERRVQMIANGEW